MKPRITIRLFDHLSVRCGDNELLVHSSAKAKEILCYLIVNRRGSVTRDALAELIARTLPHQKSRKALRHALWQLRGGLSQGRRICSARLLGSGEGWVQFKPDEEVWVDTAEFESLASSAGTLLGDVPIDPRALSRAADLHRGEFLQGWDHDWCDRERRRLKQIYLEVLDALVTYCESLDHGNAGVAYATRALDIDPARECTHRALMRLYVSAGDRASALHQFERCVSALRKHLKVDPDAETLALERLIREGKTVRSSAAQQYLPSLGVMLGPVAKTARTR